MATSLLDPNWVPVRPLSPPTGKLLYLDFVNRAGIGHPMGQNYTEIYALALKIGTVIKSSDLPIFYNIIKLKPKFWIIDINEFSPTLSLDREIIWTFKRLMTEKRMGKSSTAKVWSDPLPASNWVVGDLRKFTDDRIVYTCELTSNNDYIVTRKQRMYEL